VITSSGKREATAELTQQIADSTQQAASAERSRRASVVKETKHSESETIQTRIVANYNHSHALSMHYYEVVQVYRVITRPKKFERLLFIPLKKINFRDPRNVRRWRRKLEDAALSPYHRQLIDAVSGKVTLTVNALTIIDYYQNEYDQAKQELQTLEGFVQQYPNTMNTEGTTTIPAGVESQISTLRQEVNRKKSAYENQKIRKRRDALRESSHLEPFGVEGDSRRGWWRIPAEAKLVAVAVGNEARGENLATTVIVHLDNSSSITTNLIGAQR